MRLCFQITAGLAAAIMLHAADSSTGRVTLVVRADPKTGKLVRSPVVTPRVVTARPAATSPEPGKPADPSTLREAIDLIAAQHALPAPLVHSVIKVESNYNPFAVSPKGAQGLMQLIPSTARRFGVSNVFNPVENIKGGARYLRYLVDLFHGNYYLALAAYNAGEQNVLRYGGVPPFNETRNYLIQVDRRYRQLKSAAPPQTKPAPQPQHQTVEVKPVEVHNAIHEVVDSSGRVYYVSQQD